MSTASSSAVVPGRSDPNLALSGSEPVTLSSPNNEEVCNDVPAVGIATCEASDHDSHQSATYCDTNKSGLNHLPGPPLSIGASGIEELDKGETVAVACGVNQSDGRIEVIISKSPSTTVQTVSQAGAVGQIPQQSPYKNDRTVGIDVTYITKLSPSRILNNNQDGKLQSFVNEKSSPLKFEGGIAVTSEEPLSKSPTSAEEQKKSEKFPTLSFSCSRDTVLVNAETSEVTPMSCTNTFNEIGSHKEAFNNTSVYQDNIQNPSMKPKTIVPENTLSVSTIELHPQDIKPKSSEILPPVCSDIPIESMKKKGDIQDTPGKSVQHFEQTCTVISVCSENQNERSKSLPSKVKNEVPKDTSETEDFSDDVSDPENDSLMICSDGEENSLDTVDLESTQLFEGPIGYGTDYESDSSTSSDTDYAYGCGICHTIAGFTKESFTKHQRDFHCKPLQCKVCWRSFTTTNRYEAHMMTHIRYPCLHCPKEFRHPLEVEDHQGQHFANKLFRCDRCGEEFYLLATLRQHCLVLGSKCPEVQKNVQKIKQELASPHPEELVRCTSGCSNRIPKSRMADHIEYHTKKNKKPETAALRRSKRLKYQ